MKQATFLICAFLVLFQVCSTFCDETDASTTADAGTVTVKVSDLYSSAGPLNDLSGRWDDQSATEDSTTTNDETVDAPISLIPAAAGLRSCVDNPSGKHLLCSKRRGIIGRPTSLGTSGSVKLDNERDPIVHTEPQLTK